MSDDALLIGMLAGSAIAIAAAGTAIVRARRRDARIDLHVLALVLAGIPLATALVTVGGALACFVAPALFLGAAVGIGLALLLAADAIATRDAIAFVGALALSIALFASCRVLFTIGLGGLMGGLMGWT